MTHSSRTFIAECLGTFILASAVGASVHTGIPAPVVAGLTLLTLVYVFGPVSGAHVNPAVTVGLLSIKAIKIPDALRYIAAQLLGGLLALFALQSWSGLPLPVSPVWPGGIGELIGAVVLVFGVATVVKGKVPAEASGAAVGFSLFTGASVAAMASPGVLNPAVALGLGAWTWSASALAVFVLMPLIGGIAGAWTAQFLQK